MDKELIEHIKDKLHTHEEAYTPGSWERFAVQEEKKRRRGFVWWPIWSAAALLLFFTGLYFLYTPQTNQQMVAKKSLPEKQLGADSSNYATNNHKTQLSDKNEVLAKNAKGLKEENSLQIKGKTNLDLAENTAENLVPITQRLNNFETEINPQAVLNRNNQPRIASNFNQKAELVIENKKHSAPKKLTFEDILAMDSYANKAEKTTNKKSTSKWEPGVFVAPVMGNDSKVNMNYGFSLSYALANKLSISSGIAYTALSSTSNPANNNAASDVASSAVIGSASTFASNTNRTLESVNANLSGINIPLELKYSISKKFYTGIGVSALAILNNNQDKNFIVSQAQNTTVSNSMGIAEQKMLVVTERISEPQTESAIASDKYIGFYNFSLGYKQKISGKKNFSVEPFLRLPMKTFSQDNLNLTNGGLRLKLDF